MIDLDALVVGAGVAGSAAALELLSAGWRVGLLQQRDRVSAIESLSPAAVRSLSRLSVQIGCVLPEIVAWWGSDCEVRLTQPGACIVQRGALADTLRMRAITRGATIIEDGKLLSIERVRGRWLLGCNVAGEDGRTLTATYLVDATGRASLLGRQLGAERVAFDQLFSVSVSLQEPDVVGTWTESTVDGWWNLSCVREEGTVSFYSIAARIRESRRDIAARFFETRHLRHLLRVPASGESSVRPCGSSRLAPCAGPGWISVGDAASTLQPLASAGVSKALRDARMVPWALQHRTVDYDRFQSAEFGAYLGQLAQHYALEKRWPSGSIFGNLAAWQGHREAETLSGVERLKRIPDL